MTEAEGEGYLEPAAGPDQKPGVVGVEATSKPSVGPLHLGEGGRGSTGTRRAASAASETWAATPGMPPGATPGRLEPGRGGNLLGGPQPYRGEREQADLPLVEEPPGKGEGCSANEGSEESTDEGGPTAQERKAPAPPRVAAELDGGGERWNLLLVEEPPGQEGD